MFIKVKSKKIEIILNKTKKLLKEKENQNSNILENAKVKLENISNGKLS